MTTIAYRDGILACDSEETHEDDKSGEVSFYHTDKIYRRKCKYSADGSKKLAKSYDALIGTRGEIGPSLIAVDWWGTGEEEPDDRMYSESQFDILVLQPDGLWTMDQYFRPWKINIDEEGYFAVGSGMKAALGAMYMGATAIEAIAAAIQCDPGTGGAIISESL